MQSFQLRLWLASREIHAKITVNLSPHSNSPFWGLAILASASDQVGFITPFHLPPNCGRPLSARPPKKVCMRTAPLFPYSVNWTSEVSALCTFKVNEKAICANIICHVMQQRQLFCHILTKLCHNEFKVNDWNINHFKKHIFDQGPNIPADSNGKVSYILFFMIKY